jgi:hypothetical protein
MLKHFNIISILGFDSFNDFATSIFSFKNKLLSFFAVLFGVNFQLNFWSDPNQIVFLWVLLFCDLITGILSAIRTKTFTSTKLPRWCGIVFTYSLLLFLSFNLAKYSFLFAWLPMSLYSLFCATVFVSLFENFNKLGWIQVKVYDIISKKINDTIDKI